MVGNEENRSSSEQQKLVTKEKTQMTTELIDGVVYPRPSRARATKQFRLIRKTCDRSVIWPQALSSCGYSGTDGAFEGGRSGLETEIRLAVFWTNCLIDGSLAKWLSA